MTSPRLHRILRQHVMTDRLLGVQSLPVDVDALQATPPQSSVAPSVARATAPPPSSLSSRQAQSPPPRQSASPPSGPVVSPSPSLIPRPAVTNLTFGDTLSRDQRLQVLQQIDMGEVRSCMQCDLHQSRTQTVFGEGNPEAQVMFIGEGPGEQEDKTGRPFVGPAGQLLDKMIYAMGLSRDVVYIANIVKCRPPNNRPPQPEESDACNDYLARQIALVMPKVIVTLGAPATRHILDTSIGITALRGKWSQYLGLAPLGPAIPVMPTYHPSYILRAYTVDNRKKVWGDLQAVMEKIKQD